MVQHCTDDSLKKLFSIVKVNNTLTCNSPIEIPYYSSKLFKESLYFNCGAECKEKNNYGEYFPYCEDCSASVKNKKRRSKENKFALLLQDIGTSYQEALDGSTTTQTPYTRLSLGDFN
ncbi:hypothetical protein RhiirC2_799469 [Rhizophagus irregularis]|uniref:Uncharacterized protein n=1 Tax=Rhizophagus irregularis TaxID=588596 RepID=A0A2N1M4Z3_9GLOM|nr:hypothetical protein RhiirC2_799469 [Rhizophagus irregularis]